MIKKYKNKITGVEVEGFEATFDFDIEKLKEFAGDNFIIKDEFEYYIKEKSGELVRFREFDTVVKYKNGTFEVLTPHHFQNFEEVK